MSRSPRPGRRTIVLLALLSFLAEGCGGDAPAAPDGKPAEVRDPAEPAPGDPDLAPAPEDGEADPTTEGDAGAPEDDDPQADIERRIDESLRGTLDPEEWEPLSHYDGQPVVILRELDPGGERLMRIYTALPGSQDELPTPHGPDWRYFDTGLPSRVEYWRNGIAHGPQRAWWRTGRLREEALFERGVRIGTWVRYGKMGQKMFEGAYVGGRPDGPHRSWFGDGQLEDEQEFDAGVQHGRHRTWSRDGILLLDERWARGVLEGRWSSYYPTTGQPRLWGEFDDDRRVGVWRTGREDGAGLLLQETYVEGLREGPVLRWSDEGQLVAEEQWAEDVRSGPSRTWYPNGSRQSEGQYEQGQRTGDWLYWSPDGSVNERWTGRYENDRLVQ